MTIKLNMKQTYDQMSWSFLRRMLQELDFRDGWIGWIMDRIEASSFAILVNGTPTKFFHSSVDFRQGCSLLSTCLFYVLMPYLRR